MLNMNVNAVPLSDTIVCGTPCVAKLDRSLLIAAVMDGTM